MPKKILLIENEPAFADEISRSLEASGFETRVTSDGKEGLDLSRDWAPEAIVLCVELPGMSGYLVCQKLKKDEALKSIPLVLTSAEATEETFEKHKSLKARADEYLLKPYEPAALVDKLAALVGLPEGAPGPSAGAEPTAEHEEELVSLEEEIGLDAADGRPDAELPGLDLESLPDEPAAGGARAADDDLRLLDDAFDGLSAPPAPEEAAAALDLELAGERPVRGDDVDAAAASLPDGDEGASRSDLGALDDEAERALGALGGADESLAPSLPETEPTTRRPLRGASADLLRAAGIKVLDEAGAGAPVAAAREPAPEPPQGGDGADKRAVAGRDAELKELKRKTADLSRRAEEAEAEAEKARAQARRAEADAKAARDESRRNADRLREAESDVAELRKKLSDAEDEARRAADDAAADAVAKAEALEREMDDLRTELLVARGEAEGARAEIDKRTADVRKRLAEVEATSAKNEERVVKAYQKIKADEKIRDKVRKALAIAAQLLDEGLPPESDKDRRPTPTSRD